MTHPGPRSHAHAPAASLARALIALLVLSAGARHAGAMQPSKGQSAQVPGDKIPTVAVIVDLQGTLSVIPAGASAGAMTPGTITASIGMSVSANDSIVAKSGPLMSVTLLWNNGKASTRTFEKQGEVFRIPAEESNGKPGLWARLKKALGTLAGTEADPFDSGAGMVEAGYMLARLPEPTSHGVEPAPQPSPAGVSSMDDTLDHHAGSGGSGAGGSTLGSGANEPPNAAGTDGGIGSFTNAPPNLRPGPQMRAAGSGGLPSNAVAVEGARAAKAAAPENGPADKASERRTQAALDQAKARELQGAAEAVPTPSDEGKKQKEKERLAPGPCPVPPPAPATSESVAAQVWLAAIERSKSASDRLIKAFDTGELMDYQVCVVKGMQAVGAPLATLPDGAQLAVIDPAGSGTTSDCLRMRRRCRIRVTAQGDDRAGWELDLKPSPTERKKVERELGVLVSQGPGGEIFAARLLERCGLWAAALRAYEHALDTLEKGASHDQGALLLARRSILRIAAVMGLWEHACRQQLAFAGTPPLHGK